MSALARACRLLTSRRRRTGLTSGEGDAGDLCGATSGERRFGKPRRSCAVRFAAKASPPGEGKLEARDDSNKSGVSSASTRMSGSVCWPSSPSTQASCCELSEAFPMLDSDDEEPPSAPLVAAAHGASRRVRVCEGLFFQGAGEDCCGGRRMVPAVAAEEDLPAVPGPAAEPQGRPLRFFGPAASEADAAAPPFGSAAPEGLYVDCRATPQDDPDFVRLLGARVCHGRVKALRMLADGDPAEGSVVVCDVAKYSYSTGVEEITSFPLADLVRKLREVQRFKSDAALEQYQRALCSRSMAARRRQFLGVAMEQ